MLLQLQFEINPHFKDLFNLYYKKYTESLNLEKYFQPC